ncbi:MAG: FAD-dependent oxidoreductase, partial [Clostridia bacterium]|nr:FAD-dependent oxidoreductase [Clostridia bacterium]
ISGNELADRMLSQAMDLGLEFEVAEVTSVRKEGKKYYVTADGTDFESVSVIFAVGAAHRRLGLDGEDELIGRGISFCAVCDGAMFAGKRVAVVGGGNSAVVEAALLAETCESVTLIQNLSFLTAEKTAAEALLARENVSAVYDTVVTGYLREGGNLNGLVLKNTADGSESSFECDGAFIAIGLSPATSAFGGTLPLDEYGYVLAGENCSTGRGGIFVAGDCRIKNVRQITTAVADGATAALAACNYVDGVRAGEDPSPVNTSLSREDEEGRPSDE